MQAPPCLSKTPFVVQVTDTCKECSSTQINTNAATFEKYLATSTGLMGILFRQVHASSLQRLTHIIATLAQWASGIVAVFLNLPQSRCLESKSSVGAKAAFGGNMQHQGTLQVKTALQAHHLSIRHKLLLCSTAASLCNHRKCSVTYIIIIKVGVMLLHLASLMTLKGCVRCLHGRERPSLFLR